MHCKQEGACKYVSISGSKVKLLGYAEKIESNCSYDGSEPAAPARPLSPQHSQERYNDHIETGNKTSLSRSGVDETHLLESSSTKEDQPS